MPSRVQDSSVSATNRGERGGEGTIADVLAGRAQWVVVEGDCLELLPMFQRQSVDHVITDPPYEAEAHTLQRRITRQDLPGNRWGGGRRGVGVAPVGFDAIRPEIRRQAGWMMARSRTCPKSGQAVAVRRNCSRI